MKPAVSGSEFIKLVKIRCAGRRASFACLAGFARLAFCSPNVSVLAGLQNLQDLDNRKVVVRVDTPQTGRVLWCMTTPAAKRGTSMSSCLNQGVQFSQPANITAPMVGAPTAGSVSFPAKQGSTTVFEQQFNSRGFPVVATPATINALYVGNGTVFRALTLTSVGGIRSWKWYSTQWTNTRATQ